MRIVLPASKAAGSAMTQRVTVSGTAAPTIPSSTLASRGDLTGCPWNDAKTKLRGRAPPHAATPGAGPDPVRQRRPPRDRRNALRGSQPGQCAVATVYHTLNFFTGVGLLRQVAVDGSKSYFDTNNSEHHHFYIEDQHELMDVPRSDVVLGEAPVLPEGYEIVRVDLVIRLRRKARQLGS